MLPSTTTFEPLTSLKRTSSAQSRTSMQIYLSSVGFEVIGQQDTHGALILDFGNSIFNKNMSVHWLKHGQSPLVIIFRDFYNYFRLEKRLFSQTLFTNQRNTDIITSGCFDVACGSPQTKFCGLCLQLISSSRFSSK
jgi:type IV secretory pathway VirB6-like protein